MNFELISVSSVSIRIKIAYIYLHTDLEFLDVAHF